MAHDTAQARVLDRRTGAIAGEHVVRAALVGRFAMAHRADDAQLVGHAGRFRPHFAKNLARQLGLYNPERAAILQRGIGLGVERLLLGHSAGQKNMQDALGSRRLNRSGRRVLGGLGLFPMQQVAEDETHRPQRSDRQKFAPRRLRQRISRGNCIDAWWNLLCKQVDFPLAPMIDVVCR